MLPISRALQARGTLLAFQSQGPVQRQISRLSCQLRQPECRDKYGTLPPAFMQQRYIPAVSALQQSMVRCFYMKTTAPMQTTSAGQAGCACFGNVMTTAFRQQCLKFKRPLADVGHEGFPFKHMIAQAFGCLFCPSMHARFVAANTVL